MKIDYNDDYFINSLDYKEFMEENNSYGMLKIRAYSASEAMPVKGVNIEITSLINNSEIVFFKGITNESGIIEKIILPAPKLDSNNMMKPLSTDYIINASYPQDNFYLSYKIKIYSNICSIQDINVIPNYKGDIL